MFRDFLLAHKKNIIVWLIVCAVFAVVFSLYELPLAPVLYGAVLSGFFGAVIIAAGYVSYRRKRTVLQRLADEITLSAENIPLPQNGIEEDYTKLIHTLYDSLKAAENEAAEKLSDMTDYYTMWVHQIKTPIAAMGLIRRQLKLVYKPLEKTVLTDEKWLLFVIEQIISNAVKYTPSGEVEIYCEEPLTLCIRDTGIGIAPEDIPRIFEKGYTGCNGRLDKKASGIGLYLCRRICGTLGHKITAESGDSGTVIRLYLESRSLEIE